MLHRKSKSHKLKPCIRLMEKDSKWLRERWVGGLIYKSKRKKMVWGGSERSPTPSLQKNISVLLKIIFFLVLQGLFLDSQD